MVALLVAEKPSVGQDWGRLFAARRASAASLRADKVWITWCVGHLTTLAEPHAYEARWRRWRADTLPIMPATMRRVAQPSAVAHVQRLTQLVLHPQVTEIANACDAGREGELIFAGLLELTGCTKPVTRVWLSSMTDAAMRAAWQARRPAADYRHLTAAARCRSEADWLVGLNATRAVTLAHRRGGGDALMPVGRVQTPTLAMLAAREAAIASFVPTPFWRLKVPLATPEGPMPARWQAPGGNERLATEAAARALAARLDNAVGAVSEVVRRRRQLSPPPLWDLTSLQRRANRRLGLTAEGTLAAAQVLYERHKAISYPRTDARHLTEDGLGPALAALGRLGWGPWEKPARAAHAELGKGPPTMALRRRLVNAAKVGDHPAIVPTGARPPWATLSPAQAGVYELIVRRFLAAFLPPAELAETRVVAVVDGERLVATGTEEVAAGWHLAESPDPPLPAASRIPAGLARGMAVRAQTPEVVAASTQPPPHLGDASLLAMMERAGADPAQASNASGALGTPATRAAILESLLARGLARREGRRLRITDRGRVLVAAVAPLPLASAAMTGAWEARLAQVARGELGEQAFMTEVRALTIALVAHFFAAARVQADSPVCPSCRAGRVLVGRRGWGCSRWRAGCGWRLPFTLLQAAPVAKPPTT